jgi:hypothetical protein
MILHMLDQVLGLLEICLNDNVVPYLIPIKITYMTCAIYSNQGICKQLSLSYEIGWDVMFPLQ